VTAEAAAALAATSTGDLLTKAFALTHQIDAAARKQKSVAGPRDALHYHMLEQDKRTARDLIVAEVLRRAGEGS